MLHIVLYSLKEAETESGRSNLGKHTSHAIANGRLEQGMLRIGGGNEA